MENLNSLNRRSENVVIKAVIIAELELSDIEREILGADLVERADDTALEDAPKALNRLSVDGTHNILALAMIDGCVGEFYAKLIVASPLIRASPGLSQS
jgi:hypothetical protein